MLDFYMDDIGGTVNFPVTPNENSRLLPFYLLNSGSFNMGDRYYTRRDGLNNFLLISTTDGCGKMQWKEQTCTLTCGSAVLINCNTYHEYQTMPNQTWTFDFIHFGALSMEGYKDILLNTLTPVELRSPKHMKKLFEDINMLIYQNNIAGNAVISHRISGMLTELLCSLAENTRYPQAINRKDISSLAEFIQKNFVEDLHIEDFMKIINLSRHYLIHLFERQMGMSPYHYLHMCRVNYAQKLLISTDMSISEIGYSVGYKSTAVFIRHFKSFHGVSPGEYRSNSIRML